MSESIGTSQSSPESIKSRLNDPLEVGRYVTVQRSDGKLDSGFKITFIHNDGNVVVQKEIEGEEVVSKKISIKKLEELNPPRL